MLRIIQYPSVGTPGMSILALSLPFSTFDFRTCHWTVRQLRPGAVPKGATSFVQNLLNKYTHDRMSQLCFTVLSIMMQRPDK
jgi:hypothetical protein